MGTIVRELVYKESNGFYRVEFRKVRFYINSGQFSMEDFLLSPTDSTAFASPGRFGPTDTTMIYGVQIPKLYITPGSLINLYFKRELKVRDIELFEPILKIVTDSKLKKVRKRKQDTESVYKAITKSLRLLQINNFLLERGHFEFITRGGADYENYLLENISIKIENFLLTDDPGKPVANLYYTDNVEIEIKNQQLLLFDSLHKMTFDRFFVSSITDEIILENFKIEQRPPFTATSNPENIPYRLNVFIPSLHFEDVDFIKAYQENILSIRSITITDPDIRLYADITTSADQEENTEDRKIQIADYLKLVDLGTIRLANGNLDLFARVNDQSYRLTGLLDKIKADKVHLGIPSSTSGTPNLKYETVDLQIGESILKLPGYENQLEWEKISATGAPMDIRISNLTARKSPSSPPALRRPTIKLRHEFSIESIDLYGLDLNKYMTDEVLTTKHIAIQKPAITLTQDQNQPAASHSRDEREDNQEDPKSIQGKVIEIGKISVNDGNIRLKKSMDENVHADKGSIKRFNFMVQNVLIDSSSIKEHRYPFLNNIIFNLDQLTYEFADKQQLNIDALILETNKKRCLVENLSVQENKSAGTPKNRKPAATIRSILMTGFNLSNAVAGDDIDVDTFHISPGRIELNIPIVKENRSQARQPGLPPLPEITINDFRVDDLYINLKTNDKLRFSSQKLNIRFKNIHNNPLRTKGSLPFLLADKAVVSADRYLFFLNDDLHYILADRATNGFHPRLAPGR